MDFYISSVIVADFLCLFLVLPMLYATFFTCSPYLSILLAIVTFMQWLGMFTSNPIVVFPYFIFVPFRRRNVVVADLDDLNGINYQGCLKCELQKAGLNLLLHTFRLEDVGIDVVNPILFG